MTEKYLNKAISKYEKQLGFWKSFMENIKTFNSEYGMTVIAEYEVKNRIARMETKLDIVEDILHSI